MFPKFFSLAIKPYCILLLGTKVFVFILNPEVLATDACELLILLSTHPSCKCISGLA